MALAKSKLFNNQPPNTLIMSTSTIIFRTGTNSNAQITPSSFPAKVQLYFSGGDAKAFYGVDGQQPNIAINPGQTTSVIVNVNSLQLSYSCYTGEAKVQWSL